MSKPFDPRLPGPAEPGPEAPRLRARPGFRFSLVDGVFLALCAGATWLLRESMGPFVWIIAAAAGHFFLFCNVFRVRRSYELIWTGIFLANMAAWSFSGRFSWPGVLAVQLPVTAIVIGLEIRSPRYHGVFCRRVDKDASPQC